VQEIPERRKRRVWQHQKKRKNRKKERQGWQPELRIGISKKNGFFLKRKSRKINRIGIRPVKN
jgi:hypothetical protein